MTRYNEERLHSGIGYITPRTKLEGREQVHLFAGIAGWAYALQLAGWPAEKPVWTGSCPCQPFSSAGKPKGEADERHLWPAFYRLIEACRPPVVLGEQVASDLGRDWLAGVYADLEALGYRVPRDEDGNYEFYDIPAASVGSPHKRNRLWWVADAGCCGRDGRAPEPGRQAEKRAPVTRPSETRGLADAGGERIRMPGLDEDPGPARTRAGEAPQRERLRNDARDDGAAHGLAARGVDVWSDFHVAWCRDAMGGPPRPRRFQPGAFPLAHGLPGRVVQLRGLGNAIVPQAAAAFVKAVMESEHAYEDRMDG